MAVPDAAVRYDRAQRALTSAVVSRARAAWSTLDPTDLAGSWAHGRLGDQLFVAVSAGQAMAATRAESYLDAVLAEQRIDGSAVGAVRARAFAGVASDGRALESLLFEPVISAKVAAARGAPPAAAGRSGEAALVRIVATQLQDAGRAAVSVGMAARPAVTGYVRMLVPPSCSRCAVLAGRVYRWNTGFQRHPACDCKHIPSRENVAGDLTTDPREYFDSLDAAAQDRYFTNAGAAAIREGADIGQVVNARRGMATAGTTIEGTARRSRFRRATQARLMPERIFAESRSRADAVGLLREHGYLL